MSIDVHTVSMPDGSQPLRQDRIVLGVLPAQAHVAGGGAGATVTLAVSGLSLPVTYGVHASPSQDATTWITAKTATGFTVNIAPRLAATTLAIGTVDLLVFA